MAGCCTLTQGQDDLREKMLVYINVDEHSDLPVKQYRVVSPNCPGQVEHLIIESRTKLGALIAYADWELDHFHTCDDWEYYHELYFEKFNENLEEFIEDIVTRLVQEPNQISPVTEDDYLVEITEPTIIRPFNQTLVKRSQ